MSNYNKQINFLERDAQQAIIRGSDFDTEFGAVQVAVNSKADQENPELSNPTLTGSVQVPTPSGLIITEAANVDYVNLRLGIFYNKQESDDRFANITGDTFTGTLKVDDEIIASGDITAFGDVNSSSDIRLKSDIVKIEDALSKVKQLSGYTFLKEGSTERSTGVIAQEVQAVLPEAVTTREDGTLTVAYGTLVGILIEAIKELADKE